MCRYKLIISLSLSLFTASTTFSQGHPNNIYIEAFGSGGYYSINYDRMFTANMGGRIGYGYVSFPKLFIFPEMTLSLIPVSFNYFIGEGNSKLELGAGITFIHGDVDWFGIKGAGSFIFPNLNIGYRYQPAEGGLLFRIGFTPFFTRKGFQPWGGISIGSAF
jgi:hypothetical protein